MIQVHYGTNIKDRVGFSLGGGGGGVYMYSVCSLLFSTRDALNTYTWCYVIQLDRFKLQTRDLSSTVEPMLFCFLFFNIIYQMCKSKLA